MKVSKHFDMSEVNVRGLLKFEIKERRGLGAGWIMGREGGGSIGAS